MSRHVPHTRNANKSLKLRIAFTVTLSPDERLLLAEYARVSGHDFGDPDERTLLRRILEDEGLNALQRAAEQVVYTLPDDNLVGDTDYQEGEVQP